MKPYKTEQHLGIGDEADCVLGLPYWPYAQ